MYNFGNSAAIVSKKRFLTRKIVKIVGQNLRRKTSNWYWRLFPVSYKQNWLELHLHLAGARCVFLFRSVHFWDRKRCRVRHRSSTLERAPFYSSFIVTSSNHAPLKGIEKNGVLLWVYVRTSFSSVVDLDPEDPFNFRPPDPSLFVRYRIRILPSWSKTSKKKSWFRMF